VYWCFVIIFVYGDFVFEYVLVDWGIVSGVIDWGEVCVVDFVDDFVWVVVIMDGDVFDIVVEVYVMGCKEVFDCYFVEWCGGYYVCLYILDECVFVIVVSVYELFGIGWDLCYCCV